MKFKTTAKAHGLHIQKHPKCGWTVTILAPEAEAWLMFALGDTGIYASRLQTILEIKSGRKKSVNRGIKYICPY